MCHGAIVWEAACFGKGKTRPVPVAADTPPVIDSRFVIDGYQDIHANVRHWLGRLWCAVRELRDATTVYDIGANDGALSLPLIAGRARVIAFEPGRAAAARLRDRCARFAYAVESVHPERPSDVARSDARVHVAEFALSDERSRGELHVFDDDTFSSLHDRPAAERERYRLGRGRTETVELTRLDALVADGLPEADLVKIDVEGGELGVLRGARSYLSRRMPAILMEYSCINTRNAGYERRELLALLGQIGYAAVYGLYRNQDLTLHRDIDACTIWNVIAVDAALDRSIVRQATIR